jgi:hypothetical protein
MFYVYAIISGLGEGPFPEDGILPGTEIHSVPCGDLSAIISAVPLDVFGEMALRGFLEDAAWIKERAVAHERVVGSLMPRHTVLPLKFCTLFEHLDGLAMMIGRHREALEATLSEIHGAWEWGVKMFYDPTRVRLWIESLPRAEATDALSMPGTAFFARKQNERRLLEEVDAAISQCVQKSHEILSQMARAASTTSLQSKALHGRENEMSLNGVYLVVEGDETALRNCVQALDAAHAPHGFEFVLTGPWAPYNFTRLHLGDTT